MEIRIVENDLALGSLLREASEWLATKLLNPFQIEILREIKVHSTLPQVEIDAMGMCWSIQRGDDRPRDFEIVLASDMSDYMKVRVLAHEFVHVRQRVTRELTYVRGRTYWNDMDVTDLPWAERPQEIEANALEGDLATEFLMTVKGWRRKKAA